MKKHSDSFRARNKAQIESKNILKESVQEKVQILIGENKEWENWISDGYAEAFHEAWDVHHLRTTFEIVAYIRAKIVGLL